MSVFMILVRCCPCYSHQDKAAAAAAAQAAVKVLPNERVDHPGDGGGGGGVVGKDGAHFSLHDYAA